MVLARLVHRREKAENGGLSRFVPEFDVVFRGVVQAAFGSGVVSLVEIALAELAIGNCEPFFVADRSMMIERVFK